MTIDDRSGHVSKSEHQSLVVNTLSHYQLPTSFMHAAAPNDAADDDHDDAAAMRIYSIHDFITLPIFSR